MKLFLTFLILLSINLYSIDYSAGVGVNFDLPIEMPFLEATAKCEGCSEDVSLDFQTGIVFKNKFGITDYLDINIDLTFNYSLIKYKSVPYRTKSLELAIILNKSIDDFFIGGGIWREQYIFENKLSKYSSVSHPYFFLLFNVGYNFSDNFGLIMNTKFFKIVESDVKSRGYLLTNFSMFYYF